MIKRKSGRSLPGNRLKKKKKGKELDNRAEGSGKVPVSTNRSCRRREQKAIQVGKMIKKKNFLEGYWFPYWKSSSVVEPSG